MRLANRIFWMPCVFCGIWLHAQAGFNARVLIAAAFLRFDAWRPGKTPTLA
jgi:hypothetical protein